MSPRERTSRQGDEARYLVPGLARGLEILRLFSRERRAIAPPEMAKELGIPRSTVFRLVQTLEQMGFLERTEGGHAYRLGVAVLGLGFEYLASLEITELARPVLEQLRDDTGLTTHLVIRDGRDVVIVFKAVGRSRFTSSVNVGTRLPAHATVHVSTKHRGGCFMISFTVLCLIITAVIGSTCTCGISLIAVPFLLPLLFVLPLFCL